MVVQCPSCGAKGRLDDSKIPDQGVIAKCRTCGNRLRVHKTEGVSLLEDIPPASRTAPQPTQPAAPTATPPAAPRSPEPPQPGPQTIQPRQAASPPPPSSSQQTQQPPSRQSQPETGLSFKEPVSPSPSQGQQTGPAPVTQPATPQDVPVVPCRVCGSKFPSNEMVRFGNNMVCADCKPKYVQMQRTGVSTPGRMRYGGFWIRFGAKFVDGLIQWVLSMLLTIPYGILVAMMLSRAGGTPAEANMSLLFGVSTLFYVLLFAAQATYSTFFVGKFRATPGKMIFKLMVVTPDGERVSYLRALGRYFSEIVSGMIFAIGYIMAAFDSEKRTLHDRICATRVVYR